MVTEIRVDLTTHTAALDFAERVAQLDRVAAVVALAEKPGMGVWVLLDGDEGPTREVVYGLQFATLRRHPGALIDFRVVDRAEYPGVPLEHLLPVEGDRLFVRAGVAL